MAYRQQIIDDSTGEVLSDTKIKGNGNFVQFYRNEMSSLQKLIKEDPKAAAVFMFITEHMGQDNALIVSKECLAEQLDCSVRTVTRHIAVLKEKNFIDIAKSGTSNVYMVNANIAWTTNGTKRDYAKFRAQVLISKAEQEYKIKTSRTKQLTLLDE